MKRPVILIVGAAAGALLVAAVGASAHTGLSLTRLVGVHSAVLHNDDASEARTQTAEPAETAEPTDTPEAAATSEPTETPETETADTDTETNDDNEAPKAQATSSGEHDHGEGGGASGGTKKED